MSQRRLTTVSWLAWTSFVIYGSLVPLDFRPMPLAQAWALFQQAPFLRLGIESRADWVANGVLYLPVGYLTLTALLGRFAPPLQWLAVVLAALFGAALAFGVEFTQLYFPPRTVSQNDILAECIGCALGMAVVPLLQPWAQQLRSRWQQRGQFGAHQAGPHLLQAYAGSYLLLCLFPYDLLLSAAELQHKAASGAWGWWLAGAVPRPALAALQLGLEVVLALPFGVLLAHQRGGRGIGLVRAAVAGALLGLGIEASQFMMASGISQGASVLSRAAGVALGVAAWQARARWSPEAAASLLRRHGWAFCATYAWLLAVVNGWFFAPWHGADGVAAQWASLRWLPFYYHYYTTEAAALFSLGSVALMYQPVVALGWAFRWSTATTAVMAALLCALVEASKLGLAGNHPDPTNVLIAAAVCAGMRRALVWIGRAQHRPLPRAPAEPDAEPVPAVAPTAAPPAALSAPVSGAAVAARGSPVAATLSGLMLAAAALSAAGFPAMAVPLVLLLAACGLAVWRRPVLALAIMPAAMPVLDWAPWTGRYYWDEFDLLCAVVGAVALLRAPAMAFPRPRWTLATLALGGVGVSLAIAAWRGFLPAQTPDANSIAGYYSGYNALRIGKGALWAWGTVALYHRLSGTGAQRRWMLAAGLNVGLALTVLVVVWERLVFPGLLDFAGDYRVTGPFSAMHKGGAYVECFLAVVSAFTAATLLRARDWPTRVACALLLLGTAYAVMVTFSRNGYAAFGLVLVVVLGGGAARTAWRRRRAGPVLLAAGVLVLVAGMALPIAGGPFARQRLAQSGADLAVRQAHWADALALRDPGWATAWLGMGLGRFPDSHFWRSPEPAHAGSFQLQQETANPGTPGNSFLRLGSGAAIYVEQIVDLPRQQDVHLRARLRASQPGAVLAVSLCQKWLLTSMQCSAASLAAGPVAGAWTTVEVVLPAKVLTAQRWFAYRPLKLALATPSQKLSIDVDDLRLEAAPGLNLLANGDFSRGLDHWFFTTDLDPPWHIHSLPVAVLFDQGWLGVLSGALLCAVALVRGAVAAWRGSGTALAALAALLAFGVSGSLNTLIDAPRFLWLLLLLLWLCAAPPVGPRTAATNKG